MRAGLRATRRAHSKARRAPCSPRAPQCSPTSAAARRSRRRSESPHSSRTRPSHRSSPPRLRLAGRAAPRRAAAVRTAAVEAAAPLKMATQDFVAISASGEDQTAAASRALAHACAYGSTRSSGEGTHASPEDYSGPPTKHNDVLLAIALIQYILHTRIAQLAYISDGQRIEKWCSYKL